MGGQPNHTLGTVRPLVAESGIRTHDLRSPRSLLISEFTSQRCFSFADATFPLGHLRHIA